MASRAILGMRVDATSYDDAADRVVTWARQGVSRTVCVSNVHMVMEGYDHPEFRSVVNSAALVTPDGVPLVWALRLLGVRTATRVYGPDLTAHLCARAAREDVPVAFVGSTDAVLRDLRANLGVMHPELRIVHSWSPPFRELTPDEESEMLAAIERSGARIVFVGLGCPKQERWMARYGKQIQAPVLGVGAAFDFLARHKSQAPGFLQRVGLEWLFRLITEPRRLWRRYVFHNPRFVVLFAAQWLRSLYAPVRDSRTPA